MYVFGCCDSKYFIGQIDNSIGWSHFTIILGYLNK